MTATLDPFLVAVTVLVAVTIILTCVWLYESGHLDEIDDDTETSENAALPARGRRAATRRLASSPRVASSIDDGPPLPLRGRAAPAPRRRGRPRRPDTGATTWE